MLSWSRSLAPPLGEQQMAMVLLPRGWVSVEVVRWRDAGWTAKHSHRRDTGYVSCRKPTRVVLGGLAVGVVVVVVVRGSGRGWVKVEVVGGGDLCWWAINRAG